MKESGMSEAYTIIEAHEGRNLKREFAEDVRDGLTRELKSLPCKYFYDERGSRLFSRIMDLDSYYLTDCEAEILETHKASLCAALGRRDLNVVELGAGDGKKTRILLGHLVDRGVGFRYVPIDISESAMSGLTRHLKSAMPELETHGLVAEYGRGLDWLSCNSDGCRNLVLFLGSSIGNFSPDGAQRFLRSLKDAMRAGDHLLVGFDLVKDVGVMRRAYDDPEGMTALFNLNLLERINRELGGRFEMGTFDFRCEWDPEASGIQSYLVSVEYQRVHIDEIGQSIAFHENETIHTESSHKFTVKMVEDLAAAVGFEPVEYYFDSRAYFLDALFRV
jgi:dimethylhistidine N-methyltransferase